MKRHYIGRTLVFLLIAFLSAGMLFAGGGQEVAGPAGVDLDAEPEGTIEVWGWNVAASSLQVTADLFMELYPNVEVIVSDIGRTDVYDRVTVGLAADGAGLPDVIQLDERLPSFSYNFPGGFMDLTELMQPYMDQIDPSKIPVISHEGNIIAAPWDSGPVGVFFRRDLFEAAGVNPDDIETWDDYLAAGEAILEATGARLFQVDMANDDGTFRMLLNQVGNFYFNEAGEIIIHHEPAVRAMEFLAEAHARGLVLNTPSWDAILTATANGDLATIPFGVWYSGSIKDVAPDLSGQWGAFPLPAAEPGANRAANLGGSNLVIPANTSNPTAAWRFAEFSVLTVEGQMAIMEAYGIFPSFLPALETDFFAEPDPFFGGQEVWQVFVQQVPDIPPINYTSDFTVAEQIITDAQAAVLLEGADPRTALRAAAEEIARQTGRTMARE